MGYQYNGRLRSAEVLLCQDGSTRLIRRAETPEDYFSTAVWGVSSPDHRSRDRTAARAGRSCI